MISIELIRQNPDAVKEAMRKRDAEVPIDRILELDRIRRSIISETDTLRARRNEVSRQMGRSEERPQQLIEEMRSVGRRIRDLEDSLRDTDNELDSLMLKVPNIPDVTAPVGPDELANIEVKRVGDLPSFDFEPKAHWDIAEALGIIDFERGVRLAGSRFFVLKGNGAKLQRAVISFMIDMHVEQHGYTEVYLPYIVNRETVQASGHLPGFQEEMYHDEEDDLWMLPTAEAAITSLHRDEILSAEDLPLYYVAHTPCWRREKASAGRDTRGIMRVHQFDKVEMYKFVAPDESTRELESLVVAAEDVVRALEIPYRVLELATGDMATPAVKAFDVEMWAPGADRWLEVSSCSNCTDFQSRRGRVRYRTERGARPRLVHTLNGSGLALPRVIISILENYQQADGSVVIPEALRPYTGFDRIG
ncbi:MAG: serine--tRNA ligase [Dehalococcoidia bacterium]|nr:serine--tRNA ligase [Dehalococcoidia bacterium]